MLNLAHVVQKAAEEHESQTALILDDFRMTYGEFWRTVRQTANLLREKGVGKGDKIAIMLPNTPQFPIAYFGALYVGATVVPVNVLLTGHEIQYYLEDSEATVFFAWKGFYEDAVKAFQAVETCHHFLVVAPGTDNEATPDGESFNDLVAKQSPDAPVEPTMADDTAVVLYTSGTTGHPKGAELTHFNVFFNAYFAQDKLFKIQPEDVTIAVLPLFHSFGQVCVMIATLMAGATLTMMPRFETERLMEVIARDKVTCLAAVPTMYFFILNYPDWEKYDLSSLRMACSGAAACPVDVLHRFEERYGVKILEGYGLSETSPVASFNIIEKPTKPGSVGLPIWGTDMAIMREDGSFAEVEEVGEIVIRGHNVMKGYLNKPEATHETIIDGWLHTGDMGRADDEGYFYIVDRKKDLVIRGGMNIYPREIEEVLYGHPAVLEAAVIGVPDEARGEEVKAYVSLREGAEVTVAQLLDYCAQHLAKYKLPKEVEVLEELPKGPTGKILKRELRDRAAKGLSVPTR